MSLRETSAVNNMSKLRNDEAIALDIPSAIGSLMTMGKSVPTKGKMSDKVYHRLLLSKINMLYARHASVSSEQVCSKMSKETKQKIKNAALM